MSTKFIIEDKEFINELERLQYEVEAKKNIISYILIENIDTPQFKKYHDDYVQTFIAYQRKKNEVEVRFVKNKVNNPNSWILDFGTGELIID